MLIVVMLTVVMLTVVMLTVVMLTVLMLTVLMLTVVIPTLLALENHHKLMFKNVLIFLASAEKLKITQPHSFRVGSFESQGDNPKKPY
jgi:hypothetical protein